MVARIVAHVEDPPDSLAAPAVADVIEGRSQKHIDDPNGLGDNNNSDVVNTRVAGDLREPGELTAIAGEQDVVAIAVTTVIAVIAVIASVAQIEPLRVRDRATTRALFDLADQMDHGVVGVAGQVVVPNDFDHREDVTVVGPSPT